MTTCIDCGKRATGERCRSCRAKYDQRVLAPVLDSSDKALIRMRDVDRLSLASIARRLGVSRPSVHTRLARARARQKILKEME